jgi:hypothetical protein
VGFWDVRDGAATMQMPEAPMNENDFVPGSENQVGSARQVLCVQPVSVPKAKDESPHDEFWP